MNASLFAQMTLTAALTVWSPGPNNILLLSTASSYGLKKNLRLMLGIWSGSLTLMCLCGIFCGTIGRFLPGITPVMKYVGAAYILYLAYTTLRRTPPSSDGPGTEPSYLTGLFLQLLNVKIILYGLTMFSSFILPYESRIPVLFLYAVYLMVLGAVGNLIWAFAGSLLKTLYAAHYKVMNVVMAGLLGWCCLRIVGVL